MKKYIYILGALLAAFGCSVEQPYELTSLDNEPEDGAKVTIEFSLPPVTKGIMAHDPDISTIHVAVFNKAGVLKQFEQATLTNPGNVTNGDNPSGNPKYSVDINMSASKRILHFIADSPVTNMEDLAALGGTSGEAAVLNALTTAGTECAYWQRVELDKVDAYTYAGGVYKVPGGGEYGSAGATSYTDANNNTVNIGDYIKRDGTKILDGTGYFQSQAVAKKVANIAFIRNFAEIKVTAAASTTSNFTPRKFALVNVPKAGYVAPYDPVKSEFAEAYLNPPTSGGLTHTFVKDSGYPGTLVGNINPEMPTSFIDLESTEASAVKTAFMYERPIPTTQQPATCIIVGGNYTETGAAKDSEGLTWFKIEIADEDGNYFPIYRGVSYLVKIGSISGSKGYDSPEAANAAPAIGDVSGSVETASLEQINDGKGTTLWVEYTDHVATSAGAKTLYYTMYYQKAGGDTTYLTHGVNLTVNHPNATYKAITDATVTGVKYTGKDSQADLPTPPSTSLQWYVATVNLDEIGDRTKYSVLHVEGTSNAGKKMFRDVNYRVMGTQKFKNGENELSATSLENEESGQQTTLSIYLPNDLGMSMFPLVLRIEAKNGNYTTVDGLPVESGPSLFDSSKNAFYFLKTINYSDYYNTATGVTTTKFQAKFKTTRDGTTSAAGTNATDFRVLDKVQTERNRTEPYFEYAECHVSVGGPVFTLVESSVSVKADATTATLQLRSNTSGTWTLTPSANVTELSQTTGTGNATVTVTFPANTDESAAKTYTVTATLDEAAAATIEGYTPQVFTITQAEKKNLVPVTRTIATTRSTFNTSYMYTGEYSDELKISFIGGYNIGNDYITLNNTNSGLTIEANTITRIVITWDYTYGWPWNTDYSVDADNTEVDTGSISYTGGSATSNNNITYPNTTWTGSSDSVSFSFGDEWNRPRIRQIEVTYLHEAE